MTNREFVLNTMRKYGRKVAEDLQEKADSMTGTELYEEYGFIPSFYAAVAKMNMLERPVGFVCRSPQGRVVKLLQPYDSTVYQDEPEELPAQWGYVWSKEPKHALPFVAISTSPYMTGDCCTEDGVVYRSLTDNNVWSPAGYPNAWEEIE